MEEFNFYLTYILFTNLNERIYLAYKRHSYNQINTNIE